MSCLFTDEKVASKPIPISRKGIISCTECYNTDNIAQCYNPLCGKILSSNGGYFCINCLEISELTNIYRRNKGEYYCNNTCYENYLEWINKVIIIENQELF